MLLGVAVKVTLCPWHMAPVVEAVIDTAGATRAVIVMVSQSDRLELVQPFASVTLVIQNEVVEAGVTETFAEAVVRERGHDTPVPDPFTLHGPFPLSNKVRFVLEPAQIVAVPESEAWGLVFT